jgi:hypothetical protein
VLPDLPFDKLTKRLSMLRKVEKRTKCLSMLGKFTLDRLET